MAGITLDQATDALNAALAAHAAILSGGEEYRRGDRMIRCPPLADVEKSITLWQAQVDRLNSGFTSGGPRISGITPC